MSKYSDKVKRRLEAARELAGKAAFTAKTTTDEPFACDGTQRARAVQMADQCAKMARQLEELTKSLETLTRKFEFLEDLHLKTAAKNTAQKRHIALLMTALAARKIDLPQEG